MNSYRLNSPLQAVKMDARGKGRLLTLAAGTVLQVEETPLASGLIDVMLDGERFNVFGEDLELRSDPLSDYPLA